MGWVREASPYDSMRWCARRLAEVIGGPAFGFLVDVVGDRAMSMIIPDDSFIVISLPDFDSTSDRRSEALSASPKPIDIVFNAIV